jgi:hypothetical protein
MAARNVIVLPVRYLRSADSIGWAAAVPDAQAWLRGLDDEITFALTQRRAAPGWTMPGEIIRVARRNASFAPDPTTIAAEPLRPRGQRMEPRLPEPLASQIRSLFALRDDARFVLLPVEVRFEADAQTEGQGRAVLNLLLLDARLSQVLWGLDVASDASESLTPAVAASLGSRVADLVAAP